MSAMESAFTYVPGATLLHRWSSVKSGWVWRIASKAAAFVLCFVLLVQCSTWFHWRLALCIYATVFLVSTGVLAASTSWHKAQLLLRDTGVLCALGLVIGLPLYVGGLALMQVSGFLHGESLLGAAVTVVLLITLMSASLGIAAVFLS